MGRFFLIVGVGYASVFGTALAVVSPHSFGAIVPVLLPAFAVLGSMGAMVVFSNDRQKGVLEYLVAYGVSPRRQFGTILAAGLALASIVLGTSATIALVAYLVGGHVVSSNLAALFALYALPMSYVSAAFAVTVGMYWTSISSPRTGMNSPIGLLPLVGVAPSLVALGGAVAFSSHATDVLAIALVVFTVLVALLISLTGRLLRTERLLSPA